MGGGFDIREPANPKIIHQHVIYIFIIHQWMGLFENLKGYDDEITHEFSMAIHSREGDSATTIVRGLSIHFNANIISRVTKIPLGLRWDKEDRTEAIIAKNNFFLPEENPVEDNNGVRREILPYPWDEVAYHILKYISCEGRLSVVYAYQFRLLYELRF